MNTNFIFNPFTLNLVKIEYKEKYKTNEYICISCLEEFPKNSVITDVKVKINLSG